MEALAREVSAFDPDVVGFSTYLWSFPYFVEVARILKEEDPRRLMVFGGPSARPSMMGQPPYRQADRWVDALVINEGEHAFREIIALTDRSPQSLMSPAFALRVLRRARQADRLVAAGADVMESPTISMPSTTAFERADS